MLANSKNFLIGIMIVSLGNVSGWAQGQAAQGQAAQGQAAQGQAAQGQAAQGQAQQPAAQGQPAAQPQKQVKDIGEHEVFTAVTKETDPNKKLALLNTWKEKYPNTDFKKERQLYFLDTYRNLNQPDKMVQQAKEMLADDPKDFTAMFWIASIVPSIPNAGANAEYVDLADKAGKGMIENMGATFAPEKKPATTTDEQWTKARKEMEAVAHKSTGWAAMVRKNNAEAKDHFTKSLEANPAAGEVSYWLGLLIVGEKNLQVYPTGLYHIARAAAYDGPGALSPQGRQQVNDYLTKAYTGYHGDTSGLNELKAQAKASALPPADFKIPSVKDIAEAKLKQEEAAAAADPMGAQWKNLKANLTGETSAQIWAEAKGAAMPRLRGTVVEATPKTIVVALSDKTQPEVTLEVDGPVGKVEPGTVIEFEGVAKDFTKEPFMLTMEIERSKISGLPAAAPAPKKPAGRKPGAAKRRR